MTSLFMGTINTQGVPADENTVRNTATPVESDAPSAEAPSAPDTNELETDRNPNLGMVGRQLGSHFVESQQYPPFWRGDVDDSHLLNDRINAQVSTSGTAAQREAAGQFGHGTMQVAEGIEPVFDLANDAHKMGNTYFKANDPDIQSSAGNYMSVPPGYDYTMPANDAAIGKTASRQAQQSALYDAFWLNQQGA